MSKPVRLHVACRLLTGSAFPANSLSATRGSKTSALHRAAYRAASAFLCQEEVVQPASRYHGENPILEIHLALHPPIARLDSGQYHPRLLLLRFLLVESGHPLQRAERSP